MSNIDHFWPKSLNWPFRCDKISPFLTEEIFFTEYDHFCPKFEIWSFRHFWPKSLNWPLRPNVAIFDGISPFSREFEHFMAKYHHFWPKKTLFTQYDHFWPESEMWPFRRQFGHFWPNMTIFDQFLTISDLFWPNQGNFWPYDHFLNCPF